MYQRHHASVQVLIVPTDDGANQPILYQSRPSLHGVNPDAAVFVAPPMSVVKKTVLMRTAQASIFNTHEPQLSEPYWTVGASGQKYRGASDPGSEGRRPKTCDIIRIVMKVNHGPGLELSMLFAPHICEPLTSK